MPDVEYYAHTPPQDFPNRWHGLKTHLIAVAESASEFAMESVLRYQLIDPCTRFKGGIELDERVRPKQAICQTLLHISLKTIISDADETADIGRIIFH